MLRPRIQQLIMKVRPLHSTKPEVASVATLSAAVAFYLNTCLESYSTASNHFVTWTNPRLFWNTGSAIRSSERTRCSASQGAGCLLSPTSHRWQTPTAADAALCQLQTNIYGLKYLCKKDSFKIHPLTSSLRSRTQDTEPPSQNAHSNAPVKQETRASNG